MQREFKSPRETQRALLLEALFLSIGACAPFSVFATLLYAGFLALCAYGVFALYTGKVQNNAKPYKHRAIEFAIVLAYAVLAGYFFSFKLWLLFVGTVFITIVSVIEQQNEG